MPHDSGFSRHLRKSNVSRCVTSESVCIIGRGRGVVILSALALSTASPSIAHGAYALLHNVVVTSPVYPAHGANPGTPAGALTSWPRHGHRVRSTVMVVGGVGSDGFSVCGVVKVVLSFNERAKRKSR